MKAILKLAPLALVVGMTLPANSEGRAVPVTDPVTKEECSACHMAYPVSLLASQSWDRIMSTLSDHFGEDASLDPATTEQIRQYLVSNSQSYRTPPANPPMRISELPWFQHEHGARARAKARANSNIGSISNCQGCHRGAERGFFDDD